MDGLINLYKPTGLSSAQSLYRVRKITGVRKSGHAGTLDPLASGVLILCLGKATKLVEALMDQPKVYRARARLDVTSESFDSDRPMVTVETAGLPTAEGVQAAVDRFQGEIEQVPPIVSALKVGGRPAYKLARAGQDVNLQPRAVRVYWTHVHSYKWPELDFEVCCGRGTYIRALIRDIGTVLETGGCLTELNRTRVGPFAADDAWVLEALSVARGPEEYLVPLEAARERLAEKPIAIPPAPDRQGD
jgi:tRNA pseudouridine55 synthase